MAPSPKKRSGQGAAVSALRRVLAHLPPVVVLLASLVLGFAVADRSTAPADAQWAALLATGALLIAGLGVVARAAWEFRRHRTTLWPHGQPTRLLRTGPFGWSRNPVYLGLLLLALIPFAWTGEPVALVGAGLLFAQLQFITIPFEEERLRLAFPDDFPRYCQEVRRWL
jgi:protein-S-isoprenylcysteine O-methyltransferase Ste14